MSQDVVSVVVGSAETTAAGFEVTGEATLQGRTEVVRYPTAVMADEAGTPVVADTGTAQGSPVDGLLASVGDPVPVRVGSRSWPAERLVAAIVAEAAAAVAAEPASRLVLVVPDEWHTHRRTALHRAVREVSGRPVTTVGAATGLLEGGATAEAEAAVLVLEGGADLVRASVCSRGDGGWKVNRSSGVAWGGSDIDDELLDFVQGRSSSGTGPPTEGAAAARAACTAAREDLTTRTATEVQLPGFKPVRLVRADVESLVGGTVSDVVDRVVADVADPDESARYSRVLATGPLASLPVVVEAVSRATGLPVQHLSCEEACRRHAVAGLVAEASAGVVAADSHPVGEQRPEIVATALAPRSRHRRGKRSAGFVAAAVAASAVVAGVTMTDAGEAALQALVESTVPSESAASEGGSSDRSALAAPTLPWNDDSEDGGEEATGDGEQNGTGVADEETDSTETETGSGSDEGAPTDEGDDGPTEEPSSSSTGDDGDSDGADEADPTSTEDEAAADPSSTEDEADPTSTRDASSTSPTTDAASPSSAGGARGDGTGPAPATSAPEASTESAPDRPTPTTTTPPTTADPVTEPSDPRTTADPVTEPSDPPTSSFDPSRQTSETTGASEETSGSPSDSPTRAEPESTTSQASPSSLSSPASGGSTSGAPSVP